METNIAVFRGKENRKTIHKNEWWFSVADVVVALADTVNATDYIKKMRSRDEELGKGWGQIVTPLWLDTEGGKQQVNCANTEGIFRIIQSIPSPKAEPFKRWRAKVAKLPEKQELTLRRRPANVLFQERTTMLNPSQKRKLEESDKIFMKKK